jgi:hypothetical protein
MRCDRYNPIPEDAIPMPDEPAALSGDPSSEVLLEAEEALRSRDFLRSVSLSVAVLAVLAALSSFLSSSAVNAAILQKNEALSARNQAIDAWLQSQSRDLKAAVLTAQKQTLIAFDRPPAPSIDQDIERNRKEQEDNARQARALEDASKKHSESSENQISRYQRYFSAASLYLIAVAVAAVAALDRSRVLHLVALLLGVGASVLLLDGFLLFA